MPRTANLYGPRTNKEVARVVKNYNARLRYELKKNPDAEHWLPDKISVKSIKAENRTRADLNQTLRELQSFTHKTAQPVYLDKGIIRTQWEINQVQRAVNEVNRQRRQQLKATRPNTAAGTMGLIEQQNLKPMRFEPEKMTAKDWQAKKQSALMQAKRDFQMRRAAEYQQQYIQLVRDTLGQYADRIVSMVKDLPPAQMIQAYRTDAILNIKFISDPISPGLIAQEVISSWEDFLGLSHEAADDMDDWGDDLEDLE